MLALQLDAEEPQRAERVVDRPLHGLDGRGAERGGFHRGVEDVVHEDGAEHVRDHERPVEARRRDDLGVHGLDHPRVRSRPSAVTEVLQQPPGGPARDRVPQVGVAMLEDDVDHLVDLARALGLVEARRRGERAGGSVDLLRAAATTGKLRDRVMVGGVEGDLAVAGIDGPPGERARDLLDVGLGVVRVARQVVDPEREQLLELAPVVLVRHVLVVLDGVEPDHHGGVRVHRLDERSHVALAVEPDRPVLRRHQPDVLDLREAGGEVIVPEEHQLLLQGGAGLPHVLDPLPHRGREVRSRRREGLRREVEHGVGRLAARATRQQRDVARQRTESRAAQQMTGRRGVEHGVLVPHPIP